VRIFKYMWFTLSVVSAQTGIIKVSSLDSDTVLQNLNERLIDDQRLSLSFQLESFSLNGNESTYKIIDGKKKIDTLMVNSNDEIHKKILDQVFYPYRNVQIDHEFDHIGKNLVSRYSFITEEPNYQLGLIDNKLGASVFFMPAFESNFSGILGMSKMDNNWTLNGELNLQMENYFNNAESSNFYWKRIDSLSQIIKLGFSLPHPFAWNTGIDIKYHHEIFRGLFTSMENRYMLNTFVPLLNSVGIGYVHGRISPTEKGSGYGYKEISYQAFSFVSKKEDINDRYLPTSGNAIQLMVDGGLDNELRFINSSIFLMSIIPINNSTQCKLKFTGKGITYGGSRVPMSRYYWFGGASSIRGYDEQQFSATQFQVSSIELGYRTSNMMQAIAFIDVGSDQINIIERNWFGYGIGLSQLNKDFMINLEYGLSGTSLDNGKLHVKWVSRL
tara:strand:+ start:483 stop:1811 length:1329 start_codon:yes stop_codon:yes gene_type:complete